jgi:hypothetical protein
MNVIVLQPGSLARRSLVLLRPKLAVIDPSGEAAEGGEVFEPRSVTVDGSAFRRRYDGIEYGG